VSAIRGRHTELVSVYVPSGGNINDSVTQIFQEKGTASNIKSKNTRKNVLTALEKIIQHLRLFKQTPPNGLVVFCGNISAIEGKEDIKIWSFEPPVKMTQKVYWCDQAFVVEPLQDLIAEKEVYGLLVLDAKEATFGMLRGKLLETVKKIDSTVPSKTVKGGMCVEGNTLMQLESGKIIPIKELKNDEKILSYSFKNFAPQFVDSFEIFKRKARKAYKLILKEPSSSIILTGEHKVFVVGRNGIEEKFVEDLNEGDVLLKISQFDVNNDERNDDKEFAHLLGYALGDGTLDKNRIILYDKDTEILKFYKKIADKYAKTNSRIIKRRNSFELRIYSKFFADFVAASFPKLLMPRQGRDIDDEIMRFSRKKLSHFLNGLYDAEGYVDSTGIGMRLSNEKIIKKIQLMLLRFGIVSSLRGPDELNRFELRITNPLYICKFRKEIGFASQKKTKKLQLIIRKYKSGHSTRVPISGLHVRKLIENEGFLKQDFLKYSMFLTGRRNIGLPVFSRLRNEMIEKIGNRNSFEILEKLENSNLITTTLRKKELIKPKEEFFDLFVPDTNSFIASGIVVHNSQSRYDGIREDALNEFFRKVADLAAEIFLKEKNMVGVILGGPGPTKENFYRNKYLNYQIQNKILGVKDVGYTGPEGLEELLQRSQDLLKEAAISKERATMAKFYQELKAEGNVVYGYTETDKAIDAGAVEILIISEDFNWVHVKLRCADGHEKHGDLPQTLTKVQKCEEDGKTMEVVEEQNLEDVMTEKAAREGAKVQYISTSTPEGRQFKELGGIGAFLRYKITSYG
jgi:peptide subunit release factor 1 (eRF1)/intein/homing endonuclease